MSENIMTSDPTPTEGLVTLTHVIYALHAITVLTGLLTPVLIVTAFLTGWPSLLAVVLNYVKRSETRGTYLESHFSWQIRTFWFAVFWVVLSGLLVMTLIGIPVAFILVSIAGLWVLYRVIRGWLRLNSRQAMP
ncbi:MAG: DUF4870 family protein [Thiobacillus sp.]